MDFNSKNSELWDALLSSIPSASQHITSTLVNVNRDLRQQPILAVADQETASSFRQIARPLEQARQLSEVLSDAEKIFSYRMRMNHPASFAFIPAPVSPLSFLGDMLTSAFNPHAGSWLQSSGPSAVESGLIRFLAERLGLPGTAGGLFVSSGSMANLTALVVARDQKLGQSIQDRAKGVIYVSDQTHSSIAKGLRIIGFMDNQIRKIKSNGRFQMNIDALREAISLDKSQGLIPFLIVASCGTTNTGSIDPLHEIVAIARNHSPGLWVHVDGAYGASTAMSKSHRQLLDGIGEVDSVSWDAHKWLFQTYGCGMVFVRERRCLTQSFATGAEYTRDAADSEDLDCPNFWNFGPELTRPARAMKLWFTLQVLGLDTMGEMIDHGFSLADVADAELRKLSDWEIISGSQMAIVNFRYVPKGWDEEQLDALNSAISKSLIQQDVATALTTKLLGKTVIRICSLNPNLTEDDMRDIISKLDATAKTLAAST
ncbi:pyridoxal phosphate-dependent transferase [Xylogone sp. PMI_703]|nr:pyridoxal phosphate-dependent transferase [Xylogone sp. PMI_703]